MASFTWLGGSLSSPSSWSQPDPHNPVEPGASDDVTIAGTGTVVGSVGPSSATVSGTFKLDGSIVSALQTNVGAGTLTVDTGGTLGGGGLQLTGGKIVDEGGAVTVTGSSGSFNIYSGGSFDLKSGTVADSTGVEAIGGQGMGTFIQSGGTNSANCLTVIGGSYDLNAGTLNVGTGNEYIGNGSGKTATFTQNGGTDRVQTGYSLAVGYQSAGSYDLKGGKLIASAQYIGQNTEGTFTQTGGTNGASDRIVLGINLTHGANGTGTYTLGGNGTVKVQTMFIGSDPGCHGTFNFDMASGDAGKLVFASPSSSYPNLIVGGEGVGTFNQGGGAFALTSMSAGFRASGVGNYNLKIGTISSETEKVGDAGTGKFTQNSGTNTVSGDLVVGNVADSIGHYLLENGSLSTLHELIGEYGTGDFDQTGGTDTASTLSLGDKAPGRGSFDLEGGKLHSYFEIVGDEGKGTFTQTGGMNVVTSDLYMGVRAGSNGTYDLTGGTLKLSGEGVLEIVLGLDKGASGTMNISNSTVSTVFVTDGSKGEGHLTVDSGGKLDVTNAFEIDSQSVLDSTSGYVEIGTGTAEYGTVTVDVGGTLKGAGEIKASLHETADGKVLASGGTLTISGKVDGGGTLKIGSSSTLVLDGKDANDVLFDDGTSVLKLEKPSAMTGTLKGLQIGDTIDLVGIKATAVSRSSETLTVTEQGGTKLTFHVLGSFSGTKFVIADDGHGGSNIVLQSSSNPAPAESFVYPDSHGHAGTYEAIVDGLHGLPPDVFQSQSHDRADALAHTQLVDKI